jgi:hypothetical protein
MASIDVSAPGNSEMNLAHEMEKYHLNSDDEPLKGFYESDEEVEFKEDQQTAAGGSTSLFGKLTSAF